MAAWLHRCMSVCRTWGIHFHWLSVAVFLLPTHLCKLRDCLLWLAIIHLVTLLQRPLGTFQKPHVVLLGTFQ